jgi:diadenosine tetraphosphate (Ap4A) HIT family hydrolase
MTAASYDRENIFAKILRGEIPSHKLYEDDRCLAILDIFPVNLGHLLVIPKAEAVLATELEPGLAAHLFTVGVRLSKALRRAAPRCEGVNFWISDGAPAGQEVPHVHLHVIPRFNGDGFGWRSGPNNRQPQEPAVLKSLAEALKTALEPGSRDGA